MVGAETPEIFKFVKDVLQHMGKNVINCNVPGAG